MKRLLAFFKTTLLGGALVVLPVWLAVLLLLKLLIHLEGLVKPLSAHLPEGVIHTQIVAIVAFVLICFLVGFAIRTTPGRAVKGMMERTLFERIPGYRTMRNIADQMTDMESNHGFKPALVEVEEALAPGFIVETQANGSYTIFLPSAPTPLAGTILVMEAARVHPFDVPLTKVFSCVSKWGAGTGELLAALPNEFSQSHR